MVGSTLVRTPGSHRHCLYLETLATWPIPPQIMVNLYPLVI